nr:cell division protein FtsL [Clostridium acetireducens]
MEKNWVNGSTVLKPERYTQGKNKNNNNNRKRKKEKVYIKNKIKTIKNILLIFTVGIVLVSRYCIIYGMQKGLNNTKNEIECLNKENENLRVELVKYNNIQFVEENAVEKLKMVSPKRENAIYCDLDKNNFKKNLNKENSNKKNFLEVIKKAISAGVK